MRQPNTAVAAMRLRMRMRMRLICGTKTEFFQESKAREDKGGGEEGNRGRRGGQGLRGKEGGRTREREKGARTKTFAKWFLVTKSHTESCKLRLKALRINLARDGEWFHE